MTQCAGKRVLSGGEMLFEFQKIEKRIGFEPVLTAVCSLYAELLWKNSHIHRGFL